YCSRHGSPYWYFDV
nr:immunoglobulin heavy chain junction region [Mus musculus]